MKFSIITPTYNSASTLESTIVSVKSQKNFEIEHIIVDGGSVDDTIQICKKNRDLISRLISEPDQGLYDAMNKGILCASGDIVSFLNSDDFYLDGNVLSDVAEVFDKEPNIEAVLGAVDFVEPGSETEPVRTFTSGSFRPWMMRFGLMPPHPATFVRRETFNKVGLFNLDYKIGADFDFFVRAFLIRKIKFSVLPRVVVRMRTGGLSNRGLNSIFSLTREFVQSLKDNKVYSNTFFILLRLPIKFIGQIVGHKWSSWVGREKSG